MKNYIIAQLDEIEPVECSCGASRRAFVQPDNPVATLHMVDISQESQAHYHRKLTKIYVVLEGEGFIELDGEQIPIKPFTSVLIKPGCRHKAVGNLKILNIPIPAFDPNDEWFDIAKK